MIPDNPLDDGLVFDGEAPLVWSVVDRLPEEPRLTALNAANESLIRSYEALDDSPRVVKDDSAEWAHDLARLESKLNLALELLSDLLMRHGDVPPPRLVRFNASGLEWRGPDGPRKGQLARLCLYACARLPKPLELYGEVVRSERVGDEAYTVVRLVGVSQNVSDGVERMVFRRHRREVAQIRGRDRQG